MKPRKFLAAAVGLSLSIGLFAPNLFAFGNEWWETVDPLLALRELREAHLRLMLWQRELSRPVRSTRSTSLIEVSTPSRRHVVSKTRSGELSRRRARKART